MLSSSGYGALHVRQAAEWCHSPPCRQSLQALPVDRPQLCSQGLGGGVLVSHNSVEI